MFYNRYGVRSIIYVTHTLEVVNLPCLFQ